MKQFRIGDRIPTAEAECCQAWWVPLNGYNGRCGLCEQRPTFVRVVPEDQWPTVR